MLLTSVHHRAIIHNDQTRGLIEIFVNFSEFYGILSIFSKISSNFRIGNTILIDLRRPFKARDQVQKELEHRTSNRKNENMFCG